MIWKDSKYILILIAIHNQAIIERMRLNSSIVRRCASIYKY